MPAIDIIAVGRLRNDPLADVFGEYQKRISWKTSLVEIDAKSHADQIARIEERLSSDAALVVLDERGKSLSSREFAARIGEWQATFGKVQFVIGGADGLSDAIRRRATMLLSFGAQTWPHMLARVMLIEQVYRAQQIIANHPYHRD